MTSKILLVALLAPLLALGAVLSADYAVVDVQEGGPGGHRIVVPVPLFMARLAVSFAPAEARYVEVPDVAAWMPAARRAVDALRGARDGVLVQVEERHERVLVEKAGEALRIDVVDGADEEVHVVLPLAAVDEILASYDGRGFHTGDLIAAVQSVGHGDLVRVRDGDDRVRVWIW